MHTTHPDVLKRLKRARGHLNKVIAMMEEGEACLTIAQQLQAVCAALNNAKTTLVQDHIESCIDIKDHENTRDVRLKVRELKQLSKYL